MLDETKISYFITIFTSALHLPNTVSVSMKLLHPLHVEVPIFYQHAWLIVTSVYIYLEYNNINNRYFSNEAYAPGSDSWQYIHEC